VRDQKTGQMHGDRQQHDQHRESQFGGADHGRNLQEPD
jgi:hypothetical protein